MIMIPTEIINEREPINVVRVIRKITLPLLQIITILALIAYFTNINHHIYDIYVGLPTVYRACTNNNQVTTTRKSIFYMKDFNEIYGSSLVDTMRNVVYIDTKRVDSTLFKVAMNKNGINVDQYDTFTYNTPIILVLTLYEKLATNIPSDQGFYYEIDPQKYIVQVNKFVTINFVAILKYNPNIDIIYFGYPSGSNLGNGKYLTSKNGYIMA